MKLFEFGRDVFLIFLVGDAEPDSVGGQDFHLQALGMHEIVNQGGKKTFLLQRIAGLILQEV